MLSTTRSSERDAKLPSDADARSIAYLISRYPALSMIFILREVVQLRKMGFRIEIASVNPPDRGPEGLTREEAEEAAQTYYLKNHGFSGAVAAHWQTLWSNFKGYARGVRLIGQLGRLDLRRLFFNTMYFTEALMVGRWMQRNHERHLHVHLGGPSATVGLFVRHTFAFGYSITIHGPDEFYDVRGQYLEQKIAAADFICCISSYGRSQLMRISSNEHWDKLLLSPLGVDPSLFVPSCPKTPSETFEILCVGRLTPAKGQHLLIDAVAQLIEEGRKVRLRLVGEGADRSSLEKRASQVGNPKAVVFEGGINQDEIRQIYAEADLFCIPSFAEGIPVVLMEAMAMEIPCVTTHITGIPELIRNGIDGLLVAPADLDGLVGAIRKLMDDPLLRERIGKSGRAQILEHYDLHCSVDQLAAIFTERTRDTPQRATRDTPQRA